MSGSQDPLMLLMPGRMSCRSRSPMKPLPLDETLCRHKREMMSVFNSLDEDALTSPYCRGIFDEAGIISVKTLPKEVLVYLDTIKSLQQLICNSMDGFIGIVYPEFHTELSKLKNIFQCCIRDAIKNT